MKKKTKKPMPKKVVKRSTKRSAHPNDITELMLQDHKPLKKLIKIMKDEEKDVDELKRAFEQFAPLLEAHAKPEQESLYTMMYDKEEEEIRISGHEGLVEHTIADELATKIKALSDKDEWKAHVKVLAELVEHHIEEEEAEMIPELRKEMDSDERVKIGQKYLDLRSNYFEDERQAA